MGEVPANTTSLQEATDLSRGEVQYRMGGKDHHRGFQEDGLGLIRAYDPSMVNGSLGPKSVELTEKGVRVLNEVEGQPPFVKPGADDADRQPGTPPEYLDELEEDVRTLEENLDAVRESVQDLSESLSRIEDSKEGALDDEFVGKLNAVLNALPRHDQALTEVLGVDLEQLGSELEAGEKRALRTDVLETLQTAEGATAPQPDSSTAETSGATGE